MPTVILGGGIIGSATAYYLSETLPAGDIHVVESSSQLFSSASGYAGGFLARDWFAPAVASLGELSFGLHESLAVEHGGVESDPLKLCQFLMDTAISRGVELHHPAKATSLVTDANGRITGVQIVDLVSQEKSTIPCTHLVICAGAWTSRVFEHLFPSARVSIPVSQLAGYSLVLRSPRHTLEHEQQTYGGRCHAIFTSNPFSCGFSPEIFSRQGGEIYIAGLNDPDMSLPGRAEESRSLIDRNEMKRLEAVSAQLMGELMGEDAEIRNTDYLEVLREGLCFRPVSDRGTPVVCRVDDDLLGDGVRTDGHGGVFVASGHGPWGISLSLGTGRVVADMVEGVRPSADVGNMGSAILSGLLDATRSEPATAKITHFTVSTKSAISAAKLRAEYAADSSRVTVAHGANVRAMQDADIVMLACKPFLAQSILAEPGVAAALAGKFVISVMAGKTPAEIMEFVYGDDGGSASQTEDRPVIVTAMPNVAARLRQSMTIVEENEALSPERAEVLKWIFEQIGTVKFVAPDLVNAGSMVSGAAMALMTVAVDGIMDGAVMEGFRRPDAMEVSAQVLEGLAGLLREGVHPAVLRESISSPKGCTIQGLYALEKNGVRGAYAEALVRGIKHLRGET
ncbi:hypothetical protein APSETT444_006474 [Aspergillus pseudonomiae]